MIANILGAALSLSLIVNVALAVAWGKAASRGAANAITAETCKAANTGEASTVALLQTRLASCTERRELAQETLQEVVRDRAALESQLIDQNRTEREERDALYQFDPDCGALARVPVCPALALRLRAGMQSDSPDARR